MNHLIEKNLDPQGRILLPKKWRDKFGKRIMIFELGEELVLMPKKNKKLGDLGEVEIDVKSRLDDWHALRKELRNRL